MLHDPKRFLLIAGPCSLESRDLSLQVAEVVAKFQEKHTNDVQVVFKGSFDKANRTSAEGQRGPGIEEGLNWFQEIKETFQLPVITDIHLPEHATAVAEVCDVLQIPAFLCRQTDILVAAGQTGRVVNIKKGQFLAPSDMKYAVDKVCSGGETETWLTERGTTFGYGNLVVDMRAFPIMKNIGSPVIIDASHGIQLPGGAGGQSSGQRDYLPTIAKSGIAAGADGLFLETHPDPGNAISDKDSQWPLADFSQLAETCLNLWIHLKS
jgi:2-dehydro-3-deoxyphosphooctonate aldolase (KDO 8-P synthase)